MKHGALLFALITFFGTLSAFGQENQVCIPRFAAGIAGDMQWRTTLVLRNQDMTQTNMQLRLFQDDGTQFSGIMLRTRMGQGPQLPPGPGGFFQAGPFGAGEMQTFRTELGNGPLQAGYAVIESANRIQAFARMQLYDISGSLISEADLLPSTPFSSGTFLVDRTEGQTEALAVTNLSAATANCTLELFQEEETIPLDTFSFILAPGQQIAHYLSELFPGLIANGYGYARMNCDVPVCATALQFRNNFQMLQIPIFADDQTTP